jgi:hypothetical protein
MGRKEASTMRRHLLFLATFALCLGAQTQAERQEGTGGPATDEGAAHARQFVVPPSTRIPLSLINSVSSKHSAEGDRIYLETVFPILSNGRVVIPPGSYVAGTLTRVKRPGRVRGRGELFLRFDSLTLPNGVTRDFRARVGSLDGDSASELDRTEGKIRSEGNKGGDARTVGEATAAGTSVGVIAGSAAGHAGMGAGIGAAAGATAGLMGVLLSRGPDAILPRGTTLEMVLDRTLTFTADEVDFTGAQMRHVQIPSDSAARSSGKDKTLPIPGRFPGSRVP